MDYFIPSASVAKIEPQTNPRSQLPVEVLRKYSNLTNGNIDQFILNNPSKMDIQQFYGSIISLQKQSFLQTDQQKNPEFLSTQQTNIEPFGEFHPNNSTAPSNDPVSIVANAIANASAVAAATANRMILEEKDRDSGNETRSSTSPCRTSMTSSPAQSLPSRSSSFSVTSILKLENAARVAALAAEELRTINEMSEIGVSTPKSERKLSIPLQSDMKPSGMQLPVMSVPTMINNSELNFITTPSSTHQPIVKFSHFATDNKTISQSFQLADDSKTEPKTQDFVISTGDKSDLEIKKATNENMIMAPQPSYSQTHAYSFGLTNPNFTPTSMMNSGNLQFSSAAQPQHISHQFSNQKQSQQSAAVMLTPILNQHQIQAQFQGLSPITTATVTTNNNNSSINNNNNNSNSSGGITTTIHQNGAQAPPINSLFNFSPQAFAMAAALAQQQQQHQQQLTTMLAAAAATAHREFCMICGDKASGYHYGVMSCEGCKGFFRRSIQKNMRYDCHKSKLCNVDRVTRNRCQSCRFDKCIQAGMNPGTVRTDKNRKRKNANGETIDKELEITETRETMALLKSITEAFDAAFPKDETLKVWTQVRQCCEKFLSGISAYSTIGVSDKNILIQQGLQAIVILRSIFNTKSSENNEMECLIDALDFSSVIIPSSSNSTGITETLRTFRAGLPIAAIQREELAILCAIVLTQPTVFEAELESPDSIEELFGRLSICLYTQMGLRNEDSTNAKEYAIIIRKMTELFR